MFLQVYFPALGLAEDTGGATPVNLDLSSSDKSISAQSLFSQYSGNSSASIVVDGSVQQVTSSSMLTPAEFLALSQVLAGQTQSFQLNANGTALSGIVDLSHLAGQTLGNLVIPQGLTAVHDFGLSSTLNLAGNLTNAGSFYGYSSNASVIAANIFGNNIFNNAGGLISTDFGTSGLNGYSNLVNGLSLNLTAINSIVNAGSIVSAANLAMTAPNISNIGTASIMQAVNNVNLMTNNLVNQGLIASQMNNVSVINQTVSNMLVNNTGGTMQALQGMINVGDSAITQKIHTDLVGGDWLSEQLNVHSGDGIIRIGVKDLTGVVNMYGGESHIVANTPNLQLGEIIMSGDPTYYNTGGEVTIAGSLVFSGANLAIVASSNIRTTAAGLQLNTSSAGGNGGAITLVAGANFTASNWDNTPGGASGSNDTTTYLNITGASASGGNIDLNTGGAITTINSSSSAFNGYGGDITLIAFSGAGGGNITLPAGSTINSGGPAGVTSITQDSGAGDVLLIAGAASGASMTAGTITTMGGLYGGAVRAYSATPTIYGGTAAVLDGDFRGWFRPGTMQAGNINVGAITTDHWNANGGIRIETNGSITTGAISVVPLAITDATAPFGVPNILLSAGTSVTTGTINKSANILGAAGSLYVTAGTSINLGNITSNQRGSTYNGGFSDCNCGVGTMYVRGGLSGVGNVTVGSITGTRQDTGFANGGSVDIRTNNGTVTVGQISIPADITLSGTGLVQVTGIDTRDTGANTSTGGIVRLNSTGGGITVTTNGINTSNFQFTDFNSVVQNAYAYRVEMYAETGTVSVTGGVTARGTNGGNDFWVIGNVISFAAGSQVDLSPTGTPGGGGNLYAYAAGNITFQNITASGGSGGGQAGGINVIAGTSGTGVLVAGAITATSGNNSLRNSTNLIASGNGATASITTGDINLSAFGNDFVSWAGGEALYIQGGKTGTTGDIVIGTTNGINTSSNSGTGGEVIIFNLADTNGTGTTGRILITGGIDTRATATNVSQGYGGYITMSAQGRIQLSNTINTSTAASGWTAGSVIISSNSPTGNLAFNQTAGTINLTAPGGAGYGGHLMIAKNANATVTTGAITQTGGWANGVTFGNLAAQTVTAPPAGGNVNANLNIIFDTTVPSITGLSPGGFNSITSGNMTISFVTAGAGLFGLPIVHRATGAATPTSVTVAAQCCWTGNLFFGSAGNITMGGTIGYNSGVNTTSATAMIVSSQGTISTRTVDFSNANSGAAGGWLTMIGGTGVSMQNGAGYTWTTNGGGSAGGGSGGIYVQAPGGSITLGTAGNVNDNVITSSGYNGWDIYLFAKDDVISNAVSINVVGNNTYSQALWIRAHTGAINFLSNYTNNTNHNANIDMSGGTTGGTIRLYANTGVNFTRDTTVCCGGNSTMTIRSTGNNASVGDNAWGGSLEILSLNGGIDLRGVAYTDQSGIDVGASGYGWVYMWNGSGDLQLPQEMRNLTSLNIYNDGPTGNIYLNGNIYAQQFVSTHTVKGSVLQNSGVFYAGTSIDFSNYSGWGSVGTLSTPVMVSCCTELSFGGVNAYITSIGPVALRNVAMSGDIVLKAAGTIRTTGGIFADGTITLETIVPNVDIVITDDVRGYGGVTITTSGTGAVDVQNAWSSLEGYNVVVNTSNFTNDGDLFGYNWVTSQSGTITIQNPSGDLVINSLGTNVDTSLDLNGFTGGTINILAPNGSLTMPGVTLDVSAGFSSNGVGGNINISAQSLSITGGNLNLIASGYYWGAANGGNISVTVTGANSSLTVGNGAGQVMATANSSHWAGSGGSISFSAGGSITANLDNLSVAPDQWNGSSGTISLIAGTNALSTTPGLTVSSASATYNLLGCQIAGATGNGGNLTIAQMHTSGTLTINTITTINVNGGNAGGNGGTVTIQSPTLTPASLFTINANATGSANGGTINLTSTGTSAITVVTAGAGYRLSATGLGATGNGGIVNISSGGAVSVANASGAITVNPAAGGKNGGQVTIVAGTNASSTTPQLLFGLTAAGAYSLNAGTGAGVGGTLSLTNNHATGTFALTNITSITATGNGANQGGSVTIQGANAVIPLAGFAAAGITATGGATGGGGTVTISGTSITLPAGANVTLGANAGATSGSGGIVNVTTTGTGALAINTTNGTLRLTATGTGATGNGGRVNVSGGGSVTVTAAQTSITVNPAATGKNGGQVYITAGTNAASVAPALTFAIAAAGAYNLNAGTGAGVGGTLSLTNNRATGTFALTNITSITTTGNGANLGGNVTIQGTNAVIPLAGFAAAGITATGGATGGGGTVTISGTSITLPAGANVTLGANAGATSGSGGTVNVTTTGTGALTINTTNGTLRLTATGTGATGNGGIVNVSGGGSVTVTAAQTSITVNPVATGKDGGKVYITAGTNAGAAAPALTYAIAAAGAYALNAGTGAGVGGTLSLTNNHAAGTFALTNITSITATGNGANLGGNVTIQGTNAVIPLVAFAAAGITATGGATGGGGTVTISGTSITLPAGANVTLGANAGATSGNGGTVNVTTTGTGALAINTTNGTLRLSATGTGATGNGGVVNVSGGGSVTVTAAQTSITVNPVATGRNGGQIFITAGTNAGAAAPALTFAIAAAGAYALNAGTGTGTGGTLSLTNNHATGTFALTNITSITTTGNGAFQGGSVTIQGNNAVIPLAAFTAAGITATGGATGGGGTVTISGTSITLPAGANVLLGADAGATSGNGGTVNVTSTGTGALAINTTNGTLRLSATGSGATGNGGRVNISGGGSVTVTAAQTSITVNPAATGKNGGQVYVTAGTNAGAAAPALTFAIAASGAYSLNAGTGAGTGGTLSLTNNHATGAFALTNITSITTTGNGANSGGSVIIQGASATIPLTGFAAAGISATGGAGGNGGSVTLSGAALTLPAGANPVLSANAGAGGGNGGSISVTVTGTTADLTLGTANGQFQVQARGGTTGGNGGSVMVSAGRNLTVNVSNTSVNVTPQIGTGNGGNITLKAGETGTSGALKVTGNLNADAAINGNGGSITLNYFDASNSFLIGASGANSFVSGNVSARSGMNGTGGTVSIQNKNTQNLYIDLRGTLSSLGEAGTNGLLTFNQAGRSVTIQPGVANVGSLSGSLNVTATDVLINPQAANSKVSVQSITTSGGSGNVTITNTASGSATYINMGALIDANGTTAQVVLNTSSFSSSGTISATGSSQAGSITVQSTTNLTIEAAGAYSVGMSGGGNGGTISFLANSGALTLKGGSFVANATGVGNYQGGTVNISAQSILLLCQIATLSATGVGAGAGGTLNLTTTGAAGDIRVGSTTYTAWNAALGQWQQYGQFTLTALSGASGGSGGIINVSAGANLTVDATALSAAAQAGNGNGGQINLTAGTNASAASPSLSFGDATVFNALGLGNGNGGQITLLMSNTSGNITFNNGVTFNANGAAGGSGGTISITTPSLVAAGVGAFTFNANAGAGGGNGGTIGVAISGATGDLNTGTGPLSFNATGGTTGGNGGVVNISVGRNLTAALSNINLNAQAGNGNGGQLILAAGTAATGVLTLSGTGTAAFSGFGSGSGGTLNLTASGTLTVSGLTGVSANGGNSGGSGGSISMQGATVSIGGGFTISADAGTGGGNGGSIALTANGATGDITAVVTINARGSAGGSGGNGGSLTMTAGRNLTVNMANVNLGPQGTNGNGGQISLTAGNTAAGTLSFTAPATLSVNGAGTGNGGIVSLRALTSGSSMTLTTVTTINVNGGASNGSGGQITIQAPSAPAIPGVVPMILNANGAGTGNGGQISITTTAAAAGITIGTADNNFQVSLTGGSGGSAAGNGGTLTVSAGGALTVNAAGITEGPLGTHGNGSNFYFTASTASAGTLTIALAALNISASGAGNGDGGMININQSNANSNISITASVGGALSANKGLSGVANGQINLAIAGTGTGIITVGTNANVQGDDITTVSTTFTDNGSVNSTASDGTITIQSNGALTLNGTPASAVAVTGGSASAMVLVMATGANALTISTSYTFNAGNAGIVMLDASASGGSVVIAASRTVTVTSSPYIGIFAPNVTLNNASAITASGSGQYIEVGSGTIGQAITLASGATATINAATGGTVYIGPYDSSSLSISSAGTAATLQINAPQLVIYSDGVMTFNNNVTIQATGNVWVRSNGGTVTFNGNAQLRATGASSWITVNSWATNFTINGTTTALRTTGGTGTGIELSAPGIISIGSNLTLDVGSGGSAGRVNIAGGELSIANGVTLTSTGGIALPVAMVTLGSGSVLHSNVTTGSAIGNPAGLQAFTIRGVNGGTGTISTSGGSINLWSYGTMTFDKVSGTTTLNFSGGTVNVASNNGVTTIKSGVTVNANKDINFNVNTGTVEANGHLTTTSSGSISLTAATGTLSIGANAVFYADEGNIVIRNLNTAGGTISVASGSNIHAYTLSNPILGNVTLVIGNQTPSQVTGTPPANVTVNQSGGGQVFFGTNGITTSGPTNTLNAIARNITFDSGSAPATSIFLGGGTTITADPPIDGPTTVNLAAASGLNLASIDTALIRSSSEVSRISGAINPLDTLGPVENQQITAFPPQTYSYGYSDNNLEQFNKKIFNARSLVDENNDVHNSDNSDDDTTSLDQISFVRPLAGSKAKIIAENASGKSEQIGIHNSLANTFGKTTSHDLHIVELDGCFIHGKSSTQISIKSNGLWLKSGEMIIESSKARLIKVDGYVIHLKSGAVVLVSKHRNIVRVSNLCENKAESVCVQIAGGMVPLSVGQEALIAETSEHIEKYVATDNIGRRRSKQIEARNGHSILKSEVSLYSAIQQHGLINEIMSSQNNVHNKLGSKLVKMAACLMVVTNNHGSYAQGEQAFHNAK